MYLVQTYWIGFFAMYCALTLPHISLGSCLKLNPNSPSKVVIQITYATLDANARYSTLVDKHDTTFCLSEL